MSESKSRISESGILSTSLGAMMKAGKDCEKWTNGYYYPWMGPEYIYTTTVAQEIAKQPYGPYVYLEYRSKVAKKEANNAGHGLQNRELTDLSRTDILIAGKDNYFRHAIEVKRRVRTAYNVTKDMNRLADLVASKKTTNIRSGSRPPVTRSRPTRSGHRRPGPSRFRPLPHGARDDGGVLRGSVAKHSIVEMGVDRRGLALAVRALSTRLSVMPEPGKAMTPLGRRFSRSSLRRNGAARPLI